LPFARSDARRGKKSKKERKNVIGKIGTVAGTRALWGA